VPERGYIYFIQVPGDPHNRPIPVAVVSIDNRNRYGYDVLAIPFFTSPKRYPTHLELSAGETGLPENSIAKCENISVIDKSLFEGKRPVSHRRLTETRIRQMADLVAQAMGVVR
jgi:mRNA-degrading endonuclease toxin of MazEF toxin-antitoxin module